MEVEPLEKLKLFYRWMQILRYEVSEIQKFDRVITMTAQDADYLRSYAPNVAFRPIPIGVDSDEFSPPDVADSDPVVALFVGNFLHPPNVDAARFLIHNIAPEIPGLKFVIVGSPVPEGMQSGSNVEVLGYVPDVRSLYRPPNTIVVTPLFTGSGQRVKLLEAFSMACPVVTTSVGAVGFPIEDGVHAVLAETEQDFVGALRRLSGDRALRKRLGHNARNMILERFTWRQIGKDLLDVVSEAAVSH
jgi:glycosyltransferase involved in cell wall biosynthesis